VEDAFTVALEQSHIAGASHATSDALAHPRKWHVDAIALSAITYGIIQEHDRLVVAFDVQGGAVFTVQPPIENGVVSDGASGPQDG
jgi:hypothetical protein